jgi:glycosyltransferase involved in cell wall biosynthesis
MPMEVARVKVLIYSHFFAPSVGGVETFSMSLARGLVERNPGAGEAISVTVVTQTAGSDEHDSTAPFPIVRRPGTKQLWRLISDADKAILAGPAILPLLFALLQRKPVIVTHHGYQVICPNGLLLHQPTRSCCPGHFAAGRYLECVRCNALEETPVGSVKLLLRTFWRRGLSWLSDSNVAVSEHVARRIALPHVRVIRHGVESIPPIKEMSEGSTATIQFAYVGRLVTEKGVATLLDAARLLKARKWQFRILIIGDGPEREALQKMVSSESLDDQVSFEGFRTGDRLQEALTGVSALVVPSIWEEPAGLSALEQMIQGRLIIGSDVGGLAEQIGDAGLRFEIGNSAALADQMEKVIKQPLSISELGRLARERALNVYSLDRMLQEYRELLQHV